MEVELEENGHPRTTFFTSMIISGSVCIITISRLGPPFAWRRFEKAIALSSLFGLVAKHDVGKHCN